MIPKKTIFVFFVSKSITPGKELLLTSLDVHSDNVWAKHFLRLLSR